MSAQQVIHQTFCPSRFSLFNVFRRLYQIMGKTKDLTVRSYTLVNMLKQLATDTANGVTPDPANYSGRGGGDWGGRGRGRGRGRGSSGRGGRGGGDRSSGGRSVISFLIVHTVALRLTLSGKDCWWSERSPKVICPSPAATHARHPPYIFCKNPCFFQPKRIP